jgi:cytochrome b involved in lipid metabolism
MEQVRVNRTKSKCWTVIDDNVYDLTRWIEPHPGGDGAILSLCGTDGTSAFMSQHGSRVSPNQQLERYLLGPLDK